MEEIGGYVSGWAVLGVKRWGEGLSGWRSGGRGRGRGRSAQTARVYCANAEGQELRGKEEIMVCGQEPG